MRLSSRLSDKSQSNGEVETFIDWAKYTMTPEDVTDEVHLLSTGDFVEIQIGRITLPFYSTTCDDSVTFISPKRLHCLIVNDTMISIDCQLQCMDYDEENPKCRDCNPCVQAWFLVGVDDLSVPFPRVNIVKQNFKLPDAIKLPIETADKFSEWLGKAEIAYRERLGAGSIIYLRAAFERITIEVGESAGADIYNKKGNLKTFRDVLIAVDEKCSIIPVIYAVTHHTAAEIVYGRADSTKPNMGLTTWKNAPKGRIRKSDVTVAKNYLNETEMRNLNEIVTMYLDYAERQARRGNVMYMADWVKRLDAFLQFNEEDILHDKGKVTAAIAKAFAEKEFEKFRVLQDRSYQSDFDRLVAETSDDLTE